MKVIAYNTEFECTKAEKGSDYIQLYNGEKKGVLFAGIADFSGYTVKDGEWSEIEPTQLDRIEAQTMFTALMTDTLLEEV